MILIEVTLHHEININKQFYLFDFYIEIKLNHTSTRKIAEKENKTA
jgi:hypothetical protein